MRLADGDDDPRRRARPRVVARPGHSTTDTLFVDRARRSRSPGTICCAGSRPTPRSARALEPADGGARSRIATSTACAHRRDAAAPAADRPRARHHRPPAARRARAWMSTAAAASASSACSSAAEQRLRDRRPALDRAHRRRAAVAGRLGGARSPRAAARRRRGRASSVHRRRRHVRRRRPARPPATRPHPSPRGDRPVRLDRHAAEARRATSSTCPGAWRS